MTTRSKICARCKLEKAMGDFHPNSSVPDGRNRYCKSCVSEVARQRALAKGGEPVRNISRSQKEWAKWEHIYLVANRHLASSIVAKNLQRTTKAINLARYRLSKGDRPG